MNIWILNHYASDMFFAEGGRHYSFAKYLKRLGHNPTVFCANSKHNSSFDYHFELSGIWEEKENERTNVPYVFVKARPYGDNGKDRILNMVDFYRNVIKAGKHVSKTKGKPDIIIASSVHPLTLIAGQKLAKYFKVKCICEIRDLWPESIVTYMRAFKKKNPLIQMLYWGEKRIYKKADAIVFTMEGGYDYIKEKQWEKSIPRSKVFYINNGVDLEQFYSNREKYSIDDQDLDDNRFVNIVYAGSIRKVNDLDRLLNIAKHIRLKTIRFLVWGDGDDLPKLKERIEREHIDNVILKGRVEKKYVPFITSKADVNLAHNDESPLFRFGISFNKIFDYFAAGRPIICDFQAQYNPVISSGAGESFRFFSEQEIAEGIEHFSEKKKEELDAYCNAAELAAKRYDYKRLSKDLLDVINITLMQNEV